MPLKTIGEACRQQAEALIQALLVFTHEQVQHGQPMEEIFAQLFAKQRLALAT